MDFSTTTGHFSDELTKVLVTPSHTGNVLISPLSLLTALSMLLAGSRGVTRKSLTSTLKLPSNVSHDDVDSYYQTLIAAHKAKSNEDNQLLIKNKLLVSQTHVKDTPLLSTYEKIVREKYDASIDSVDFVNNGDKIQEKVNQWVTESTNGSVTSLLNQPPDEKTILMLLNCIYFESLWVRRFTSTRDNSFLVDGVKNKTVEYMNHKNNLKYLEIAFDSSNEKIQGVAIPYRSNASMVILLPPESVPLNELFNKKSIYSMARRVITEGEGRSVNLTIPKFYFNTELSVSKYLKSMGENNLFSTEADLSGINGATNIKVSTVQHVTAIDVNKAGTKAAATTGIQIDLHIGFTTTDEPLPILLDRPFAFVIYDTENHLPLFVGKLSDPPLPSKPSIDEDARF